MDIPIEEQQALEDLYEATEGDQWNQKDNWMSPDVKPCGWFGITCADGHVTRIDLPQNKLMGNLPESIVNLTGLQAIRVEKNFLVGDMPEELAQLEQLADGESDFRYNGLATTDAALRSFIQTKQIDQDWESTQTVPPEELAADAIDTESIALTWEPITYTGGEGGYEIAYGLSGSTTTQRVTVSDKGTDRYTFSGLNPEKTYFFRMRSFTQTDDGTLYSAESDTILKAPLPIIPETEKQALEDLFDQMGGDGWTRSDNWLDPNVSPCDWYGVTCENGHVTGLSLANNGLTGTLPDAILAFEQLKILDLPDNDLGGGFPDALLGLTHLTHLHLGGNRFTGSLPADWSSLVNLVSLQLDENGFDGELPASLGGLKHLQTLTLSGNSLKGPVPEAWSGLTGLLDEGLDLRNNSLFLESPDAGFRGFLNDKQIGGEWESTQTLTRGVTVETGSLQSDFGLIAFVHSPKVSPPLAEKVFPIVYGNPPVDYRIGTYDPLTGGYIEFGKGLEIRPGMAYWFFVRDGAKNVFEYDGNPVPLTQDIDVPLAYNATNEDGWNMIGVPNQAYYHWEALQVVVDGDGEGETPQVIPLSDTAAGDYIDSRRIWAWQTGEGEYVYYSPDGEDEALVQEYDEALSTLAPLTGYWVKVLAAGVSIRFPVNAQSFSNADVIAKRSHRQDLRIVKKLLSPNPAMAYSGDTPPMPMTLNTDNGGSSPEPAAGSGSGGGCFVQTVIGE